MSRRDEARRTSSRSLSSLREEEVVEVLRDRTELRPSSRMSEDGGRWPALRTAEPVATLATGRLFPEMPEHQRKGKINPPSSRIQFARVVSLRPVSILPPFLTPVFPPFLIRLEQGFSGEISPPPGSFFVDLVPFPCLSKGRALGDSGGRVTGRRRESPLGPKNRDKEISCPER